MSTQLANDTGGRDRHTGNPVGDRQPLTSRDGRAVIDEFTGLKWITVEPLKQQYPV
jgi:hypothetical protein